MTSASSEVNTLKSSPAGLVTASFITLQAPQDSREWLISNSMGSYAMGSLDRVPRRKYHGLWVSRHPKFREPEHILLDVLENITPEQQPPLDQAKTSPADIALVDYSFGREFPAGCDARNMIKRFEPTRPDHPYICWIYKLGGRVELHRGLRLSSNLSTGVDQIELRYQLLGRRQPIEIELRPLFTLRNFHALAYENHHLNGQILTLNSDNKLGTDGSIYQFNPYADLPTIEMNISHPHSMQMLGAWYKNFFYQEEFERGYPAQEDAFCPLVFRITLEPREIVSLRMSMTWDSEKSSMLINTPNKKKKKATPDVRTATTASVLAPIGKTTLASRSLDTSSEELLVALSRSVKSYLAGFEDYHQVSSDANIIAGYPWFSAWARDACICVPGVSLAVGLAEFGLMVLENWIRPIEIYLFGESSYKPTHPSSLSGDLNASGFDSPFLMAWALQFLLEKHPKPVAAHHPTVVAVLQALERWVKKIYDGDHPILQVTDFGLFLQSRPYHGFAGWASSWMDAIVDGAAVTPRHAYPIEIQALFINTLRILTRYHRSLSPELSKVIGKSLILFQQNFLPRFWLEKEGCFADGHDGVKPDRTIRPNQLWALNLLQDWIARPQAEQTLQTIRQHLLTPVGLRTLSPCDPYYRSQCFGDQKTRDHSYHQGTVWPWLLGPYVEATLFWQGGGPCALSMAPVLSRLENHLVHEGCLGQISEIFDGDAPHAARGAPAQAWSVAELTRSLWLMQTSKY